MNRLPVMVQTAGMGKAVLTECGTRGGRFAGPVLAAGYRGQILKVKPDSKGFVSYESVSTCHSKTFMIEYHSAVQTLRA